MFVLAAFSVSVGLCQSTDSLLPSPSARGTKAHQACLCVSQGLVAYPVCCSCGVLTHTVFGSLGRHDLPLLHVRPPATRDDDTQLRRM